MIENLWSEEEKIIKDIKNLFRLQKKKKEMTLQLKM